MTCEIRGGTQSRVRRIRLSAELASSLAGDLDEMEKDLNRYEWREYREGPAIILAEISRTEDGKAVRMGGGGTLVHLILMPTKDPDVYDLTRIRISRDPVDAFTVADRGHPAGGHWRLETPTRRVDDFVVALLDSYDEEPGKVRERINRAWAAAKRGRNIRTIVKDRVRLALLQPVDSYASGEDELNALNDELESAGCGRATADAYESKQLRKLLDVSSC
jgi:hypothetical protein